VCNLRFKGELNMSDDALGSPGALPEGTEIDFSEGESSTAVAQSIWGIESQEGIMGEDLLGAHLHMTAPDVAGLIPPMANLEHREDACKLYQGLKPRNTSEAMMATLAVGLFNASLGSIADASRQHTPPHIRDINLKNGIRAAAGVADLLEKLHEWQSGIDKTVHVGNVNVEAGGQAIVGNVQAGLNRAQSDDKVEMTVPSQKRKRKRKSALPDIITV
jgi:hypothetical protein